MPNTPPPPADGLCRPLEALQFHTEASLVPPLSAEELVSLREDITQRGIQEPLAITSADLVLDGRARLTVARELGLSTVPVRVVDPPDVGEYIILAALSRRQLDAIQRAALGLKLERYRNARSAGEARRLANLRQHTEVAPLPPREPSKTRDVLARIAGVSPRTAQDAITLHQHDPELLQRVVSREITSSQALRVVRHAQRDARIGPAPPLPEGPFELLYADPPWQLGNPNSPAAPENHYPTMPLDEIAEMTIPAADNALLFLWAVNCLLPEALQVMDAWGFEYRTNLVWVKQSIGTGRWARNQHELLLLGRRGNYPAPDPHTLCSSVIKADRRHHSAKPEVVYELIERMYPHASKVELFARGKPRPGWVFWGNEVEQ